MKIIFSLTIFFLFIACNKANTLQKGKIEGLVIKNMDIDASGTYTVSGNYSSISTGGRLLENMEVETTENTNEVIVQLYPVFKSIGKDPIGERVFSYIGQMPVETYYLKTLTVKISDTAKSLERTTER
ncbi:hypothetical protein IW15_18015 [Chryseobacterium soli]|uniref:Uncharacterized protein n=1 Tax=Chryseobacterium soli TaxID=445961 RepID=A0A086A2Z0_9FLAO|nr:hypothetical protein [Chryseobacterium soli]KFF11054.1 hypothetical protein IW15_18015 [Chryseobacterium soli]